MRMRARGTSAVGPAGRKMRRGDRYDDDRNCGRGYWWATDDDRRDDRPTTCHAVRGTATTDIAPRVPA